MRVRLTYAKEGALRYIGHLDLQVIWERTARRAGLPLAYTQGFHPGPRIQIACALPLGFIGRQELVDLWFMDGTRQDLIRVSGDGMLLQHNESGNDRSCQELLQAASPPGLTILKVEQVDERAPALQSCITASEYLVSRLADLPAARLQQKVNGLLGSPALQRERRGKAYDLRPLVLTLEVCQPEPALRMLLSARPGATGRPEEVLDALGLSLEGTRIERLRLLFGG